MGGKVAVERHADVANEQPSAPCDLETVPRERQKAVRNRPRIFGETPQLVDEVPVEIHAEPLGHGLAADMEVTHQLADHVAPNEVVVAEPIAAIDREPSPIDGVVVSGQRL